VRAHDTGATGGCSPSRRSLGFVTSSRPLASPPASLVEVARRLDGHLAGLLETEIARWADFDDDLAEPLNEIRRLVLAGGKRLRPAFCHWGFVGAGGDPDDRRVLDAGAAFELMHAFALFHDDVMDGARTRRGEPTTHEVFGADHARTAGAGESRRYGEGIAILVGDLACVYSDRLLAGAPREAWDVWNELRIELNVGQLLDIIGSARHERRREKAERICRYKSGKYTIERPLHLGAVLAAPDRAAVLLPALSAYGLPLGDAFQMRDDVMGAFGDQSLTGKPVGDDLREGKPTPLLAIATERAANAAHRGALDRVGAPEMSDDDVEAAQRAIVETGALDEMELTIDRLTTEAIAALDRVPIDDVARGELILLAEYVSQRGV
jgi:geranylgeranyl diphosphate synthase, type I